MEKLTYEQAKKFVYQYGPTDFWVVSHSMNVRCTLLNDVLTDYNGLPMPTYSEYSLAPEQEDPNEAPLGISAEAFQAQTILEYTEECRTKW